MLFFVWKETQWMHTMYRLHVEVMQSLSIIMVAALDNISLNPRVSCRRTLRSRKIFDVFIDRYLHALCHYYLYLYDQDTGQHENVSPNTTQVSHFKYYLVSWLEVSVSDQDKADYQSN